MAASPDADLVAHLLTATTQTQRVNELNDTEFVFNFMTGAKSSGQDGFLVAANAASFPALFTGNGAMVLGVLGPCGLNPPHTHPRGTELQVIIEGGPLEAYFVTETGSRVVKNTVPLGSAAIFPKGSMHFQQSLSCDPTVFIASFDYADPGTLVIASNFFSLDQGVVSASLGDIGVKTFSDLHIPPPILLGAQECLDRCGIDRANFNFSTTFAGFNAFPNATGNTPRKLSAALAAANSVPTISENTQFWKNPLRFAVLGLSVSSVILMLGLLASLILHFRRHRKPSKASVVPFHVGGARGYPYSTPYDDAEPLALKSSTEKD